MIRAQPIISIWVTAAMILACTGSRSGASDAAWASFRDWLANHPEVNKARHGDCLGADTEFHQVMTSFGIPIHIHPCNLDQMRSHCVGARIHRIYPPLVRNHKMVDQSDLLVAFPDGTQEVLRSGTWSTIRYARKQGRPVVIFFPNGMVQEETA